jgi:hypothetical protein
MGRYDGEDYDYEHTPTCRPDEHNFAFNGQCWKCHTSRTRLVADAKALLEWSGYSLSLDTKPQE